MRAGRDHDSQWSNGRIFGLVYHLSNEIDDLLQKAYAMLFSQNGLNLTAFPGLKGKEHRVYYPKAGAYELIMSYEDI